MEKHEKLTLTLLGRDSWSRPVYEGSDGNLYVDTDPCADRQPRICTKYRNAFNGEPDIPVHAEFTFVWQLRSVVIFLKQ